MKNFSKKNHKIRTKAAPVKTLKAANPLNSKFGLYKAVQIIILMLTIEQISV